MRRLLSAFLVTGILLAAFGVAGADETDKGKKKGKGKGRPSPEMIFKRLDTNNDGKLSKDEFMKIVDRVKKRRGEEAAERFTKILEKAFAQLDTNKDGFLSLEEFKKFPELMKKFREKRKNKQ